MPLRVTYTGRLMLKRSPSIYQVVCKNQVMRDLAMDRITPAHPRRHPIVYNAPIATLALRAIATIENDIPAKVYTP
jgi:hypothetical protein